MSLFDVFKGKTKKTTRQLIGAKLIDNTGVETYRKDYLVYFLLKPSNIAVLSHSTIRGKVQSLMGVLKEWENMEIACLNSRESFEDNKNHLKNRLDNERNSKVRELLEKDLAFLDRIQIQTASAREFLLVARFREKEAEFNEVKAALSRMEKLLKEQGFMAKRATKEDIKRIFSVYYVNNLTQVYFDDFDGARYVKGDEMY